MATATPLFGSVQTMTITLASLASDTNLLIGRQSTVIDQKDVDDAIDVLVGGKVTTGTSPTASRQIEIWSFASFDDATYNANAGSSDAGMTVTAESKTLLRLLTIIPTHATSDTAYNWGPFSISQAYGGFIPVQWGIWMVHNTGVALNSTGGNHFVKYFALKVESA